MLEIGANHYNRKDMYITFLITVTIPNESSLRKEGLIEAFKLRCVFDCVGEGTVATTGDN